VLHFTLRPILTPAPYWARSHHSIHTNSNTVLDCYT